jgi:hypothetical protein
MGPVSASERSVSLFTDFMFREKSTESRLTKLEPPGQQLGELPTSLNDQHKDSISGIASTVIIAGHQRHRASAQLSRCQSVGNAKRLQEPF